MPANLPRRRLRKGVGEGFPWNLLYRDQQPMSLRCRVGKKERGRNHRPPQAAHSETGGAGVGAGGHEHQDAEDVSPWGARPGNLPNFQQNRCEDLFGSKDYPILSTVPETSFSCAGKAEGGYYADVETGCQVISMCPSCPPSFPPSSLRLFTHVAEAPPS